MLRLEERLQNTGGTQEFLLGTLIASSLLAATHPGRDASRVLLVLGVASVMLAASCCGAAAKIDPGIPRGTYNVLVTATADQSIATTNVAVTVQ